MKFIFPILALLVSCGKRLDDLTIDDLNKKTMVLDKSCALTFDYAENDLWNIYLLCESKYNVDTLTVEGEEISCKDYNPKARNDLDERGCLKSYLDGGVFYIFDQQGFQDFLAKIKARGIGRGFEIEDEEGNKKSLNNIEIIKTDSSGLTIKTIFGRMRIELGVNPRKIWDRKILE